MPKNAIYRRDAVLQGSDRGPTRLDLDSSPECLFGGRPRRGAQNEENHDILCRSRSHAVHSFGNRACRFIAQPWDRLKNFPHQVLYVDGLSARVFASQGPLTGTHVILRGDQRASQICKGQLQTRKSKLAVFPVDDSLSMLLGRG